MGRDNQLRSWACTAHQGWRTDTTQGVGRRCPPDGRAVSHTGQGVLTSQERWCRMRHEVWYFQKRRLVAGLSPAAVYAAVYMVR